MLLLQGSVASSSPDSSPCLDRPVSPHESVAIVVQVVDGGRGGALTVARSIARLPASHHLVLTGSNFDEGPVLPESPTLSIEHAAKSRWRLVLHLVRRLRSLGYRPVLVAHRDWLACRAAGLLTRTPVIFVSHGRGSAASARAKQLAHSLVYHGQLFVTVSGDARATLFTTLGLNSVVIENGVPIPLFAPPSPDGPLRLLYLGRFEASQKRPDIPVLVTASLLERGIDVQTTMLGDGPLADDLKQLARDRGIADRIAFPGWADNPRPYIESAHAVLQPTRWEGNPLAVLEALVTGRPVVVSRVPGTSFLAGVRGVELVEAPDETREAVERFTDALVRINEFVEADRAEHYFRSIHEFARERFTLDRMLAAWRDLLDAVGKKA
jgi:glycosyltransferase involved in cell wall biosynthesis